MESAQRLSPSALLVVGISLVALGLRLPSFDDSLWIDDLSTNFVVHGFGAGSVLDLVRGDQEVTPPLFYLLTWFTKGFDGSEGVRLVSLVAGVAAVPLTYLLGLRTVGRRAALIGSALIALAPFQVFYATEGRAYALAMTLTLLAAITQLIALETGKARWWVAYALSVAAAAYTHYTVVFVLAVLLGWGLVAHPEARRPLLLANLAALLLFAPWIPDLLNDRGKGADAIIELAHPLSARVAAGDLVTVFLGNPSLAHYEVPGALAIWMIASALALACGAALFVLVARGGGWRWRPTAGTTLILVLALATPVGLIVHNLFAHSLYFPRNLICCSGPLALAVGALVSAGRPPLRWAVLTLLFGGFAIGAVRMLNGKNQRPDFGAAVAFIERSGQSAAPVIDLAPVTAGPQTPTEAALAQNGEPAPRDRMVWVPGLPPLSVRIAAAAANGSETYLLGLPHQPIAQIARTAAREAGAGRIFVVTMGGLLAPNTRQQVADFVALLPSRFREVETRSFPGFAGDYEVQVHVLEGNR